MSLQQQQSQMSSSSNSTSSSSSFKSTTVSINVPSGVPPPPPLPLHTQISDVTITNPECLVIDPNTTTNDNLDHDEVDAANNSSGGATVLLINDDDDRPPPFATLIESEKFPAANNRNLKNNTNGGATTTNELLTSSSVVVVTNNPVISSDNQNNTNEYGVVTMTSTTSTTAAATTRSSPFNDLLNNDDEMECDREIGRITDHQEGRVPRETSLSPEPSGNHELVGLIRLGVDNVENDHDGGGIGAGNATTLIQVRGGDDDDDAELICGGGGIIGGVEFQEFDVHEFDGGCSSSTTTIISDKLTTNSERVSSKTVKSSKTSSVSQQQQSFVSSKSSSIQQQSSVEKLECSKKEITNSSSSMVLNSGVGGVIETNGVQQITMTTSSVVEDQAKEDGGTTTATAAAPAEKTKKTKLERKSSKAGGKKNKSNAEISKENISVSPPPVTATNNNNKTFTPILLPTSQLLLNSNNNKSSTTTTTLSTSSSSTSTNLAAAAPQFPDDLAKKLGPGESRVFAKVCVANLRRSFNDLTAASLTTTTATTPTPIPDLLSLKHHNINAKSSSTTTRHHNASTNNSFKYYSGSTSLEYMQLTTTGNGISNSNAQTLSSAAAATVSPARPHSLPTSIYSSKNKTSSSMFSRFNNIDRRASRGCGGVLSISSTSSSCRSSNSELDLLHQHPPRRRVFQPSYWQALFSSSTTSTTSLQVATTTVGDDDGGVGVRRYSRVIASSLQKSSFSKFDSLVSKNSRQQQQQQQNGTAEDKPSSDNSGKPEQKKLFCASCEKQVFQMELVRAEKLDWHKNCFRCFTCRKVLGVDTYQSHNQRLYCKPHFKELFQPRAVMDDSNEDPLLQNQDDLTVEQQERQQKRSSKLQLIICESQPKELPPDVVRASDAPTTGLEDIQIDVRSKFEMFENFKEKSAAAEKAAGDAAATTPLSTKRSASVLAKLKKYESSLANGGSEQNGVTDEDLHGIDGIELQSDEEEDNDAADEENSVIKEEIKRKLKNPLQAMNEIAHFKQMDQVRSKWEDGGFTREQIASEQRKEELQKFRSRLCQGKSGQLKELYEKGVEENGGEALSAARQAEMEELKSERARVFRDMFEKGEIVRRPDDDEENDGEGGEKSISNRSGVDLEVFEAGVSRESKRLFEELDKKVISEQQLQQQVGAATKKQKNSASFTNRIKLSTQLQNLESGPIVTTPGSPSDVVKSSDVTSEPVQVNTAELSNKFKFFETYEEQLVKKAKEGKRETFKRITPPREDGVVKTDKDYEGDESDAVYRDPDVVRSGEVHEDDTLQKSKTTSKMLSVFRQMEENLSRGEGSKDPIIRPLKQFTPPRDTIGSGSGRALNDSEEDEEEEEEEDEEVDDEEEEEEEEQQQDNRTTEDEFLKEVGSLARARSLRAKFERWEQQENERNRQQGGGVQLQVQQNQESSSDDVAESIESAKNLKAKFEAMRLMGDQGAAGDKENKGRSPLPIRVNRFVLHSDARSDGNSSSSSSSVSSSSSTSPQLISGSTTNGSGHHIINNKLQLHNHQLLNHGFSSLPVEVTASTPSSSSIIMSDSEKCAICEKRVYVMEKIEAGGKMYHKNCFRCSQCKSILRMDTFTSNKGTLFCTTHFKQLFKIKGNYDEGFGHETQYQVWAAKKQAAAQQN